MKILANQTLNKMTPETLVMSMNCLKQWIYSYGLNESTNVKSEEHYLTLVGPGFCNVHQPGAGRYINIRTSQLPPSCHLLGTKQHQSLVGNLLQ